MKEDFLESYLLKGRISLIITCNLRVKLSGFIANIRNVKFDAKKNCYTCDKSLILAKIEGEWTNFVKIDDKLRWEHGMYPLFPMEKQAFTLPSDSLCREDLILLKLGDHELAQQAKTNLEEIQRNDKKLREKYRKIF